ncbi:MAG: peptidase M15 family protein [Candidatus Omnitrophica bacterium]|nr:peptidase M15 family protein [Candidatus Omnitrophota bacterium]
MGDLAKDFSKWEMVCKCGCGICNVSDSFMAKLQLTRTVANIPFEIISGCRCPVHNKNEGGKETSDHLTTESIQCEGVDIRCHYSGDRLKIISAAIMSGFRRIGIAKSFIHLGMKKDNPQDVIWVY